MTEELEPATETEPPASAWARARAWVKARWWARWGVDGLMALAVVWVIMAWQSADLLDAGEPAPAFELRQLEGEARTLATPGKKTLVVFWAPWCGVCRTETGTISSLHDGGKGDYEVVSVVLGYENLASVRSFVEEEGVDYPVLLGDASVRSAFNISKYPTFYILDEEGRVEDTMVGYTTGVGLRMRLWM